jgi:hypothetical protein
VSSLDVKWDAKQVVFRMNRFQWVVSTIAILAAGSLGLGCTPGGVGDPCIPEDEYQPGFSGYGVEEVNVEAMSFQCETRLCLVNHFQGRVSCPYGQKDVPEGSKDFQSLPDGERCKIPDGKGTNFVDVVVAPQLASRRASTAVYCSCRCAGPDKTARYCKCPSGFSCTLLNEIPLGSGASNLLGSYCVRNGAAYDKVRDDKPQTCKIQEGNCGYEGYPANENPFGQVKQ